jgi:hypothetical protein
VDWGMAAGAHLDLDAVLDQEVPVPEHVVDGGDLEVHVAQPGPVATEHGQLVVHGVDPEQAGGLAAPVRDPRVESHAPEPVGLVHVRRVQAQVTELGDPGRPGERDRPGDRLLLADQFQAVAERVVERDELPDPPGPGFHRITAAYPEAGALQLGLGRREGVRVGHGAAPGIAVARMWLLSAACDAFLAARPAGPVQPLSAGEITSWRAVQDELLPRLWQHLSRRAGESS